MADNIKKLLVHYSKACSITCSIINLDGRNMCVNCPAVNRDRNNQCCTGCAEEILHGCSQSVRFGGSYTFFCPGGFMFWASPILTDDNYNNVLLAGPVANDDCDIFYDMINEIHPCIPSDFRERFSKVPSVDPDVIHSKSEILRMCAGFASGYYEHTMTDKFTELDESQSLFKVVEKLKFSETKQIYSVEYETQLFSAIQHFNLDSAKEAIRYLIAIIYYNYSGQSLSMKYRMQEIVTIMSRAALQMGAEDEKVWDIADSVYRMTLMQRGVDSVVAMMNNIAKKFIELIKVSGNSNYSKEIYDAINYTTRNYSKNLSLQDVSSHCGLSPTYFSKRFSQEVGTTWIKYLNEFRIQQSMRLLKNTNYSLSRIFELAGFEDQCYFTRVFRATTGMTPKEYRKISHTFNEKNIEIHGKV